MIEPFPKTPLCIKCNAAMRFSCQEIEQSGFVHDVFECTKCRSTQSYVTSEQAAWSGTDRRIAADRRSGADTRSEAERQMVGERRSQTLRTQDQNREAGQQPSAEQLSLFAKRIKRAMRDEKSRHLFCIASGEDDFRGHADVLRVLQWIEELAKD